jgi:hypothetical protein
MMSRLAPINKGKQSKYRLSKVSYLVLMELSIPVDVALGIGLYNLIESALKESVWVAILLLVFSGVLGAILYLIHIWQLEYLTDHSEESTQE